MNIFSFRGKSTARVKVDAIHERPCPHCNNLDATAGFFMEYHHWLFIPFCPSGEKSLRIVCNVCGEPFRSDSLLKEYSKRTKAPFYLYVWPILFGCIILMAVAGAFLEKIGK